MANNDFNDDSSSNWSDSPSNATSSDENTMQTPTKNANVAAQLTNDHTNGLATAMMNVISSPIDKTVEDVADSATKNASSINDTAMFEKRMQFLTTQFNSRDALTSAAAQVDLAIARSE